MSTVEPVDSGQRTLSVLSIVAAVSTLWLIFVGGSVTSNDAGLAVPDWPTTFGDNMFAYPPSRWVGDVFFEHTHRLTGAAVGVVMILLAVLTQLRERRAWVRRFAWVLLGGVVVQGVMGGLRVTELSVSLAIVHGCFAQLFFAGTVCMAMFLSKGWRAAGSGSVDVSTFWKGVTLATSLAILGQLIAGARYRHLDVGLAYHVAGAVVVTIMVSLAVMWVSGELHGQPLLMRPAKVMGGVLVLQLFLGVGAYMMRIRETPDGAGGFFQWAVPTLHVLAGAVVLAASVALTAGVYHVSRGQDVSSRTVGTVGVSQA